MQSNSTNNTIRNVLAGITVAMVIIPEVIASAIVVGIPPMIALHTAVIIGLITSIFGGRTGMISSTTAAIAFVTGSLVAQYGIEYLFSAVIIAGIIQILFGMLTPKRLLENPVSPITFKIFITLMAGIIFFGQIKQFKVDGNWIVNNELLIMLVISGITMLTVYYLPKFTKIIPSMLSAIIVSTVAVTMLDIDTRTIGDIFSLNGGLPLLHIPDVDFLNLNFVSKILPYSIAIATIGIFHSLIIIKLINNLPKDIKPNQKEKTNKECISQGVANTISGLFSGSGGCGMIGQSLVNVESGGNNRSSGVVASIALLFFIILFSNYIEMIPVSALMGIMFTIVIDTIKISYGTIK